MRKCEKNCRRESLSYCCIDSTEWVWVGGSFMKQNDPEMLAALPKMDPKTQRDYLRQSLKEEVRMNVKRCRARKEAVRHHETPVVLSVQCNAAGIN